MGGNAGTGVTRTIVALLVFAAPVATAHAAESPGEMAANLKELTAPAKRTELRLDASAVTSLPRRDNRFEVSLEIAPRPDYWYSIGAGTASTTTTSQVITTGPDGTQTTTTASTTDSGVTISARIFKRIGPLVLSGGVLDDRPAVGAELRFFQDRVRFEVVDQAPGSWQVTGRPSVRAGASLQWRWIYIQGGVQDLIDGSMRAGYAGVGMRWTDGDLRDLLPWVAAR